jgi:hypothetical protein
MPGSAGFTTPSWFCHTLDQLFSPHAWISLISFPTPLVSPHPPLDELHGFATPMDQLISPHPWISWFRHMPGSAGFTTPTT